MKFFRSGSNQHSGDILELVILIALYFHFCTLHAAKQFDFTVYTTEGTIAYTVQISDYTVRTVRGLYGAPLRLQVRPIGEFRSIVS